jgi:general secretion pathway protein L
MIARIFDLWAQGLAEALISLKGRIQHAKRFQLLTAANQLVLSCTDVSPSRKVCIIEAENPDKVPPDALRETRGGSIEIVVPAAAILERHLGILPGESRPFLDQVVRHQIETALPWRAADMLYATKAETLDDGRLSVSVSATTRAAISAPLAAAEACKASEISIVSEHDLSNRILASIGAERLAEERRASAIARYSLIGVMTTFVCLIGWSTFTTWSLGSDVAALDKAIATRRTIIARQLAAAEPLSSNWLEAKKEEAPLTVSVIDDLSQILPADTYLTELSLEGGHLRLTGVSAKPASLVPLLEGSQRFKDASFFTPTTRLTGNTGDRFSIEATALPGAEVMK